MLNIAFSYCNAEYHYANCPYLECRYVGYQYAGCHYALCRQAEPKHRPIFCCNHPKIYLCLWAASQHAAILVILAFSRTPTVPNWVKCLEKSLSNMVTFFMQLGFSFNNPLWVTSVRLYFDSVVSQLCVLSLEWPTASPAAPKWSWHIFSQITTDLFFIIKVIITW